MRFGLLGSLEVVVDDGRSVDIGGSQPRHLLAMLLVASGRIVPVDALIEGVWGERPPGSAAGTLQSYVSRLRRTIEPGRGSGQEAKTLVWEPPGYRLNIDPEHVDFRRFERLADEGRERLDAGSAPEARERLVEAIALWRGPALVEFAEEEFARGTATRLEDRRLAAVEDRLAADLTLGRHAAIIGELTELVADHPLREELWGHLALALYRSGRQAEALRAIDEMRRTLRDELGVDPSRRIRELESAILSHDPSLDRPDRPAPIVRATMPAERASSEHVVGAAVRLVGRRPEVAQLRTLLGEAVGGRSRLALIEGEAGIGKTRLLEQVGDDAAEIGAEVLWGRSFESSAAPVLWPWLNLLRTLLERDDTPAVDREATDALARLLAASGGPAAAPAVEANRFQLLEGIARLLERASFHQPVVILLDDLQWADPMSLELLEFLVGRVVGSRVFYAATLRDTDATHDARLIRALATLSSRPGSRRLSLGGVDPADAPELVELAIGEPAAPEVAAAIHDRAEGNPFFIAELARLLAAHDGLATGNIADVVPASVRDVIRTRLAQVPEETRDVLQVAAVIGRDVDVDLLARSADLDIASAVDRIEPAIDTRLLEMVPTRPSTFRFSHTLIREVVLDEIPPLRRARLHLRVADVIESTTGVRDDEAEIVADHLWSAVPLGAGPRAAAALEGAADVAARRYAHERAESLLQRAIELRGAMSPPDEEAELLARYRLAAVRRRRVGYLPTAAESELQRAQMLAARTGRDDLLADLLWDAFASASTACDYAVAQEMADRLVALGESTLDPAIETAGEGAWGVNHLQLGAIRRSAERFDRAVELSLDLEPGKGPLGMTEHLVLTPCYAVMVHSIADDPYDGDALLDALAARHSEPYQRLMVSMFGALSAMLAGNSPRAEQKARIGLEAIPPEAYPFFTAAAEILLGAALVERGAIEEGLARLESGAHRYRNPWVRTIVPYYVSLRAVSFARAGHQERAEADIAAAKRLQSESGERWPEPFMLLDEAEIRHLAGAVPETVVELLTRARRLAVEHGGFAASRRASERAKRLGLSLE